jgi:hypothetical protein
MYLKFEEAKEVKEGVRQVMKNAGNFFGFAISYTAVPFGKYFRRAGDLSRTVAVWHW